MDSRAVHRRVRQIQVKVNRPVAKRDQPRAKISARQPGSLQAAPSQPSIFRPGHSERRRLTSDSASRDNNYATESSSERQIRIMRII